jgi:hypothetical protein
MIDPSKILIATQCTPVEPWKSEVLRLFKSLNLFGGKLVQAKKVACFSESIDDDFKNELEELGVIVHLIESLDSRYPYANKIQMLQIKEDYDVLIALDTDVIITGDFSDFIDENKISAKCVDTDSLGLENWKKLFEFFKLDVPSERFQTSITNEKTIPWFNSGVLFIPKKFSSQLYNSWIKYNTKLLEIYYSQIFLSGNSSVHDHKFAFTDQYALALSIHDLKLPYNQLPLEFNFPTHYQIHTNFSPSELKPYLLHYHHRVSKSQNILHCFYSKTNELIDLANTKINFDCLNKIDYEILVDDCYRKILNRYADKEGLHSYSNQLEKGIIDYDQLDNLLQNSEEFHNLSSLYKD